MDAESRRRRRESCISLREQRWSMSSQRLEQIVAALMKPVSHYGQSFDRDDSGLLEEYLTAAGVHALEAVEAGEEPPPPNYAEMGLVIQSFANNYSKKVDHLSRLVSSFSRTLDAGSAPRSPDAEADADAQAEAGAGAGAGSAPRARSGSRAAGGPAPGGLAPLQLAAAPGARRAGAPGPPPTLPRRYAELQPRAAAPERALADYAGETIGRLDDFRLARRLHNGFLAEELESGPRAGGERLRPLSLLELREACARAAAPPPPPRPASRSPSPRARTPPRMPPPAALRRKRRSEVRAEDAPVESFDLRVDEASRKRLSMEREYSVPESWLRRVVRYRRDLILLARSEAGEPVSEFRGFDASWMDVGGFLGWPGAEAAAAVAALAAGRDSDDDGFYERSSSLGDSGRYSAEQSFRASAGDAEARRAASCGALLLPALAADVSRALPAAPRACSWRQLAYATRHSQPQPARVLLDVLMKATRGEVEIERGAPLSIGEFSVRAVERAPAPPEEP